MNLFRYYYEEVARDGYPPEWHTLKHLVRELAGYRCVRCGHPYGTGENGRGEWSRCDDECRHGGPVRYWTAGGRWDVYNGADETIATLVEARWRILTVHHLDGDKRNCRWWNLPALCQRCHLRIQTKVRVEQTYPWEHGEWFKAYAAGFYAAYYLGEPDLTRENVMARVAELLALAPNQLTLFPTLARAVTPGSNGTPLLALERLDERNVG